MAQWVKALYHGSGPMNEHKVSLHPLGFGEAVEALVRAGGPKPESTEGRPWGQPLKKPAGAPLNLG